jgi:Fungal specific transcription factor domain
MYLPPTNYATWETADLSQLDYYYSKVVFQLSGSWDSGFWNTLIMQLCHTEPAVRHAVNAISRAARNNEGVDTANKSTMLRSKDAYALREYNSAMKSLGSRIKLNDTSKLVPLVTCLLFTCLEFILGTVDSAMIHIRSGLQILDSCQPSSNPRFASSLEMASIQKHVAPIFFRINVLCTLFGIMHQDSVVTYQMQEITHFSTLREARNSFFEIMDPVVKFIRNSGNKRCKQDFDINDFGMDDFVVQHELQKLLQQWNKCFEELITRLCNSGQPTNECAVNIIRMQYRTISNWLSLCLSHEQCAADSHTTMFEEILELGSKVLLHRAENSAGVDLGYFSFEMEIIPPLYYTAIQCRVPSIRRRAVELVRFAPRREGLWDAHIARKLAERVIQIEEKNLVKDPSKPYEDKILPREVDRIHFQSELPGRFGNQLDPASMSRMEIGLSIKPFGIMGEWQTIVEDITL